MLSVWAVKVVTHFKHWLNIWLPTLEKRLTFLYEKQIRYCYKITAQFLNSNNRINCHRQKICCFLDSMSIRTDVTWWYKINRLETNPFKRSLDISYMQPRQCPVPCSLSMSNLREQALTNQRLHYGQPYCP